MSYASIGSFVTTRPVLVALGVALGFMLGADPATARDFSRPFSGRPDDPTWSVALHLHASLSEGSGSMEWHADKAQQYGLDVIWWTDHDWRAAGTKHTRRYDFESAVLDPVILEVSEPDDAYPGESRIWRRLEYGLAQREVSLVDTLAYEGDRSMRLRAWDPYGTPDIRRFSYNQEGSRRHNMYSLAMRPRLRFALYPEVLDATESRFYVELTLSEHVGTTNELRYVLGTMDGESVDAISLPFTPGQWNFYDLDPAADAIQRFTTGGADSIRGEDNSFFHVQIGIDVRNGDEVVVFFDDLQYEPDPALDGATMMDWTRSAGNYYETLYPSVTHHVGSEISWFRAQPHLNAFAPSLDLVDYSGYGWADTLTYAVEQVHDQGGLVSLNHMFGAGIYGNLSETEAEKLLRIQGMKSVLISSRAIGVDLLEVGYRVRHGIPLDGHVDVWDVLTANAIFLTANGVSDSHGSDPFHGWGPQVPGDPHRENNYVTWLHAPTRSAPDLLAAMAAGRAYFGDPYEFGWDSEIDLATTDGFPMGRVVVTDTAGHDVVVEVVDLPAAATVRLRQGEIRPDPPSAYLDVNWLRDEILSGVVIGSVFSDTVTIDTSLPSFVRVEVISGTGDTIALSNPIHFLHAFPAEGVKAPRVAVRVDPIRVLSAENLVLHGATFQPWLPELVLTLDEDAPGIGTMEIDCSAMGPPGSVTGGGTSSWQYDAGILTLVGFEGTGTTVTVRWGPVDAPLAQERPREVALGSGRPNPFGRGVSTEFALPHPALATLEVLDVRGRRVRILVDERRDAGVHQVRWDGTDPYGRPVAAGVYFLRLQAGGRSLTTKAVKLR